LKSLFVIAAVLLLLWLGLISKWKAKVNQVAKEPPSPIEQLHQNHDADSALQTSTSKSFDAATAAPFETEADSNASTRETEFAVEKLTDAELRIALEKLSGETAPTATEMRKLLARRWAETDPSNAAAWAAQFPESPIRDDVLEQVAIGWAASHPEDAIAWLQTLPEGESKNIATLSAAYEMARVDPIVALTLATELPAGPDRDALLEHAVSQWANQDFVAASEWVKRISDSDLRQQLLAAAAIAASSEDAPNAARLIADAILPGETQARAAVSITQRWAQSTPADAAAWISQFPDMPARDAAVENLVALWAQADTKGTAKWLNSLPDGSLRLAAISAFTNSVVK